MNSRDEPAAPYGRDKDVARQGGTGAQAPKGKVSDESLVRELYAEHAAPLLRYALRMTDGDRQRAEDIVQETLFRAWQHPEAIAERPARPWLFAVARNLAVDAHRARKARPQEVGEGALELVPVPDEADRVLESWAVADALATLRPEHRHRLPDNPGDKAGVVAVNEGPKSGQLCRDIRLRGEPRHPLAP